MKLRWILLIVFGAPIVLLFLVALAYPPLMGPLLQLLWNLSGIAVPIALVAWIVARRRKYGGGYVPTSPSLRPDSNGGKAPSTGKRCNKQNVSISSGLTARSNPDTACCPVMGGERCDPSTERRRVP